MTTALFGQDLKVTGTVFDKKSEKGIEKAMVFVRALNIQTSVDKNGSYKITLPAGQHTIEAFNLGMKSEAIEITLAQDTLVDFYLELLTTELAEFEIKSGRDQTNGISRMRSIDGMGIYEAKKNEVIILDDFAANRVSNTARQVFAKVPGLNIWESDFAGLQLDIAARGLGPSRTANFNTRQNGYDMSADALGYPESYYMPALQAVDRIEIVRGAASLQYGTQFGGMLNFKIKEAPEKHFELNVEQAVGSFGLWNSFVSVGGTKDKLDYYSYYQYRRGDGWRESSGFEANTAFTRIGYQVNERLKLGFEYSYMSYEAQQPGGLTLIGIYLPKPSTTSSRV
jgi:Fe(3+) dicitrate transport protein